MSTLIHLDDLQNGYVDLVNFVRTEGRRSSPRGMTTIELEDVVLVVDDLRDTLPTFVNRKPNLMIAAVEALQLISGHAAPNLIVAASPAFAQYREQDGSFWGAYGKRVRGQLSSVVEKLRADPDTRQAVITLWNPELDNQPGYKDYPCTIALGFRIRNKLLNMSVTMRSNDVWLGTCYDVFQFTQLQHTIANMVGIDVGTYTHTAWSLHLYERDLEKVDELKPRDAKAGSFIPEGLPDFGTARDILLKVGVNENNIDPNIRWYRDLVGRAYQRMGGDAV